MYHLIMWFILRLMLLTLAWPLVYPVQTELKDWALFGAPRDYDGDGIADDEHEGIDLSAPTGTKVLAVWDGEVIHAGTTKLNHPDRESLYGNHIVIRHQAGGYEWYTRYAHLDEMISEVGDRVDRGEVIGTVGETGLASGPHLHFSILGPGGYIDPAPLLGIES